MRNIVFIILSLLTFNALAADSSSGCGPGWYVTQKNSLLSSALRATTNGILLPTVTFGMTFGTSNCSKHSIVKKEMEGIKFATENYYEIAADTAKGEGYFLTAYSTLMGCPANSTKRFKSQMKSSFKNLFDLNKVDPRELVKETYKVIIKDQQLLNACLTA